MEIKDKVVIVTGASQGIGRATAKYLSEQGARVVLAARSEDKLKQLQKELPGSQVIVTDMRDPKEIKSLIDKTVQEFGRVDILINNAGQGIYGPVESVDLENYKEIVELNLYGPLLAMQAVIPQMKKQGGGMILNVSSMVTKSYIAGLAAYSSTKYALNSLSFTAREELKDDKILVCVMMPKMTATNFNENAVGSRPSWAGQAMPDVDSAEDVAKKIAELIHSEKAEAHM